MPWGQQGLHRVRRCTETPAERQARSASGLNQVTRVLLHFHEKINGYSWEEGKMLHKFDCRSSHWQRRRRDLEEMPEVYLQRECCREGEGDREEEGT